MKIDVAAGSSGCDKRSKVEELKSELKGIFVSNLIHCTISIYVCFFTMIKLPHAVSFLMKLVLILCFGVFFNYVMAIVAVRAKGDKFLEVCRNDYVAYFLTLHFGTHHRTIKVLQRLRTWVLLENINYILLFFWHESDFFSN